MAQFFYCWKKLFFVCKYIFLYFFGPFFPPGGGEVFPEKKPFFIATETINFRHLKFPEAVQKSSFLLLRMIVGR